MAVLHFFLVGFELRLFSIRSIYIISPLDEWVSLEIDFQEKDISIFIHMIFLRLCKILLSYVTKALCMLLKVRPGSGLDPLWI